MTELWIIGAGGHAKVVAETAQAAGFSICGFLDDSEQMRGQQVLQWQVHGDSSAESMHRLGVRTAAIGIGDNATRKAIAERLDEVVDWATIVHPSSVLSPSCKLGAGSVVFAGAIVQADSILGRHVILNTQSHLDHDGRLGDYAHLCPGAALAGDVHVGEGSLLGTGCAALPGTRIGNWCKVGAGSSVARPLEDHCTAIGVPARQIRTHSPPHSA